MLIILFLKISNIAQFITLMEETSAASDSVISPNEFDEFYSEVILLKFFKTNLLKGHIQFYGSFYFQFHRNMKMLCLRFCYHAVFVINCSS